MMPLHHKRKEVTKTQWGVWWWETHVTEHFCLYHAISSQKLSLVSSWLPEKSCQRGSQNTWEVFALGLVFLKFFCSQPLWPSRVSAAPSSSFLSFSTHSLHTFILGHCDLSVYLAGSSPWILNLLQFAYAEQFIFHCPLSVPSFALPSWSHPWWVGAESPLLHRASCFQDQRGAIHKQKEVYFCYDISVSPYQEWKN